MRSTVTLRRYLACVLCAAGIAVAAEANSQTHPTRPAEFALSAARRVLIGNSARVPAPIASNGEIVLNDRSSVGDAYAREYLRGRIRSAVDGNAFCAGGKLELSTLASVSGHVLADGSATVGSFAVIGGNVASRSGTVRLSRHATVLGNVFAGDAFLGERDIIVGDPDDAASGNVDVKGDALIADRGEYLGDVRYEGNLRLIGDPVIHGSLLPLAPGSLSPPPPLTWHLEEIDAPSIVPGTIAVAVQRSQSLALAPGAYGDLVMGRKSSLELGAGVYTFASITVAQEVEILLDLQAAPNAIEIRVKDRSRFARRLRITLTGDPSRVRFVAGETFSVGQDSTWYGTIEKVTLGKNSTLHGSAWSAGELELGPYADVDWVPLAP
jgi:predicted acyltransferase (DUF342 family)